MNTQRNDFNRMKSDIRPLLDGFISAFTFAEQIADFNDTFFEGKFTLEEAKSLRRIIDEIEDDECGLSVIKSCLAGVSSQCGIRGLEVMAYEANAIMARLEQFTGESDRVAA